MAAPHNLPDNVSESEAAAVIAVSTGEATPEQQILAFSVIVEKLSNMYGLHYYPESDRDTSFSLGKAFVGQMMVGLVKTGTEYFRIINQKGKNR